MSLSYIRYLSIAFLILPTLKNVKFVFKIKVSFISISSYHFIFIIFLNAWKVSVFRIILVRVFPHSDWMRRDTLYLSYSVTMPENTDQNNSEYGHFLRSASLQTKFWTQSHPSLKQLGIAWGHHRDALQR